MLDYAVIDLQYSTPTMIPRIRVVAGTRSMQGHSGVVNSCSMSRAGNLVASGSDDGFIKLWDTRVRRSVAEFMNQYQVTAVCLSKDDHQVYCGGIDNDIKVFDVRKQDLDFSMAGHTDTVTGTCAYYFS